ncbi:MAG: ATP-binding cassette domain-containing protein, partial [Solirubrobacteraceae bacterium]
MSGEELIGEVDLVAGDDPAGGEGMAQGKNPAGDGTRADGENPVDGEDSAGGKNVAGQVAAPTEPIEVKRDAIEFIDVYKAFGRNQVLRGLNMSLPDNQISMILGPSGTGKSVCIKHIVGLLYPDEGDVLVQGVSVPSLPDAELFEM